MVTELLAPGVLADDLVRLDLCDTPRDDEGNDEVPAYRFAVSLVSSGPRWSACAPS